MITVRLATTPAEIEAALRLRYEVFYEEEGDARYADHERRLWTDRDDGPQSHLLIAVDEKQRVVGTVRITILRDWPFIANEAYCWDVLGESTGLSVSNLLPRIARMDRGVVKKDRRGTGIRRLLQDKGEEVSVVHQCDIMVATQFLKNVLAQQVNEKLGWKQYPAIGQYAGIEAQLIFKQLKVL